MHIHFIGIGGIGMSALAFICLDKGFTVTGSDCMESETTRSLQAAGATIHIGHRPRNICSDTDTVVYTAAVSLDNEELRAASEMGIQLLDRAEFLGLLMKDYSNCIAVSGTHGKTSTTSMVSVVLQSAGLDPTILVGGNLSQIGGNVRIGKSENFITEACEYVDSFLKFHPNIAIITNIDADHLDYFRDIEHIKDSFGRFSSIVPQNGYLVVNGDDSNIAAMLELFGSKISAKILKYGFSDSNDAVIGDIQFDESGFASFTVTMHGASLGSFSLSIPGLHNVLNSTAAIISSYITGVSADDIRTYIREYTGVGRRFEKKGSIHGVEFIDDYAHHPTEISVTLSAARNSCKGRLWCIFQPHTYTRTKLLLEEFSNSFSDADKVIITDIYAAREKDNGEVHSKDIVKKLCEKNCDAIYMSSFDDIASYVLEHASGNDMVITMGAGSVYRINDIVFGS